MARLALLATLLVPLAASADPTPGLGGGCPPDHGAPYRAQAKKVALGGALVWALDFALIEYEVHVYHDATRDTPITAADADRANHAVAVTRYAGTGLFLVGAAALGEAAYLYFVKGAHTDTTPTTAIAPVVTHDQIGLALSRGF
jgi:hypothetical protein